MSRSTEKPIVIAGPCVAESYELLDAVCGPLVAAAEELGIDLYFKSSFDKANRTSIDSYRGPGMAKAMEWFDKLKTKYKVKVLTDIHEQNQAAPVAEVCDVLQIPAFLCRQTDLLIAAAETSAIVNVKKGQFLPPEAMAHAVDKIKAVRERTGKKPNMWLTERGTFFGYGNQVVDMCSLAVMAKMNVPVIFDITHSSQRPGGAGDRNAKTTAAAREFAPLMARAATATGYLDGFFLEVHTDPKNAKSDASSQLTISQATALLRQIVPLWREARSFAALDSTF